MDKLYLAGPMTGLPNYNYPAFNAAAQQLRDQGYHVENPAENHAPECGTWAGYMRNAIRQMLTCQRVAFLPNWENSKGAREEFRLAVKLDMPCYTVAHLLEHGEQAKPIRKPLALADEIQLAGKDFAATDLLNRIMLNMHKPPKGHSTITRWAMVSHLTSLGSTASAELCLWFGKNPDDVLR